MGTPQAAVPSLERIIADGHEIVAVYTQPDRPSGRGNKITFSPVKTFAIENGLAIFQPTKIKTPEAIESFRSHAADVAVVVAYGRILPETYLTAFEKGAVNVHFSLLPKYRGAAPVNWVIVNGEKETGVTTIKMDAGLDTGDILIQTATEIGEKETSIMLMERLAIIGSDALSQTLERFDSLMPKPQDHAQATLAPIMRKEDGLIDWYLPASKIINRVRGFQPFPTTFSTFNGSRLTLWEAVEITSIEDLEFGEPGTIIRAKGDALYIACGEETILSVLELQPEGKRRMATRDFNNGVQPKVGTKLGSD